MTVSWLDYFTIFFTLKYFVYFNLRFIIFVPVKINLLNVLYNDVVNIVKHCIIYYLISAIISSHML